ncbi:MAG: type II secretion system F family protein [Minisyncoccia bacterium]
MNKMKNVVNKKAKTSWIKNISFGKLALKEQIFFIKRLSFLIKAGIPILESLNIINDQTKRGPYKNILDSVISDVSNGQYLSTSLAKHKNSFGDFTINIIGFGEATGILSDNLEYLAEELRKKQELRKKIIGSLVYPIIVLLATFAITGFLMLFLFPKITPIFLSIGATLPLSTRVVMKISIFLKNYGSIVLLTTISITVLIFTLLKKSERFHYLFDSLILKTPVLGEMVRQYNLSNSTRTIGLLLKSGISISEAIPITSKTLSNLVYKKEFEKIAERISKGEQMSVYLKSRPRLFPDISTQIISVGERSGNLSNSLIYLSQMYEAEIEDFTKNLSNMIEPFLMIFMGLLVGFIAISIITPIYSITQHLTPKT